MHPLPAPAPRCACCPDSQPSPSLLGLLPRPVPSQPPCILQVPLSVTDRPPESASLAQHVALPEAESCALLWTSPRAEPSSPAHVHLWLRGLVPCSPALSALWLASPGHAGLGHCPALPQAATAMPGDFLTLPFAYFWPPQMCSAATLTHGAVCPAALVEPRHTGVPHRPQPCHLTASPVGPLPSASPPPADTCSSVFFPPHPTSRVFLLFSFCSRVSLVGSPPLPRDALVSDTRAPPVCGPPPGPPPARGSLPRLVTFLPPQPPTDPDPAPPGPPLAAVPRVRLLSLAR